MSSLVQSLGASVPDLHMLVVPVVLRPGLVSQRWRRVGLLLCLPLSPCVLEQGPMLHQEL